MKQILSFLAELRDNNNRDWFNAHKDIYLEIKDKVEVLTSRLIAGVATFDGDAARLTPSDCLYRIYRDTRFSPDKTPYKTHIGIYINPPYGKKSDRCGYYLHIEPGACAVGGGAWCPTSPLLKELRQAIYDNVEEYLEIIEDPKFKGYYPIVGEDFLKTAPKGFPKDWEHIGLLKPKSLTVMTPVSDAEIKGKGMLEGVLDRMETMKPFLDFLNFTVDEMNL